MNREIIICLLTTALLSIVPSANAQRPAKRPLIGWLTDGSALNARPRFETFRQSLRELGYIEGQNIVIEYRAADQNPDRLATLAAELVRLKPDVLVGTTSRPVRALMKATKTIPIVMVRSGDPVRSGIVASLARPGGNVTGLTSLSGELTGKRLELLKETFPELHRVAVLWNRASTSADVGLQEIEHAARGLKLQFHALTVDHLNDYPGTFSAIKRENSQALILINATFFFQQRKVLLDYVAKSRLPAIFPHEEYVESGGLMSYGTSYLDLNRRAAYYVDRILKGAKPADLPVEQPTKFELVINLKTAKQIGVTIPPEVLMRADKVIK